MSQTKQEMKQAANEPDEEVARLKAEHEAMRRQLEEMERKAKQAEEEKAAVEQRLEAEVARQEATIIRQLNAQKKVRIVIASGKDPHERCPVPVGINGREYLIERDKEVDVPQGVLNVLDLARATVAESTDAGGMPKVTFRDAPRFAYRILGHVNPATGELEKA